MLHKNIFNIAIIRGRVIMQKIFFMRHSEPVYSFVEERNYIEHGIDLCKLTENGIMIAENSSIDSKLWIIYQS